MNAQIDAKNQPTWHVVEEFTDWNELEMNFSSGPEPSWDSGYYRQDLPFSLRPDLMKRREADIILDSQCFNDEEPLKRATNIPSIRPDYIFYEQTAHDHLDARPNLVNFIEEFDWERADTLAYKREVVNLLENPYIRKHMGTLDKFESPLKNCIFAKTVVPQNAEPLPSTVPSKKEGHPNKSTTDLDYLCNNWFTMSKGIFEVFVSEFKNMHTPNAPVRVFSKNKEFLHYVESGKLPEGIILSDDYRTAHLYLFGEGDYDPHMARAIRNVWGLCFSADPITHGLPADVHFSPGTSTVQVNVPVYDRDRPCYRRFNLPYYRMFAHIMPGSGLKYIPSQTFDKGWKRFHFDPITKKSTVSWHFSTWANAVGVVSSTRIPTMPETEVSINVACEVQESQSPHKFLHYTPAVRCARAALQFDHLTAEMLSDEVFVRHEIGDEIAHIKLSVGKTVTGYQIDSPSVSRRVLRSVESSHPNTYFGWTILDKDGFMVNPQFYACVGRRGISPVEGMPALVYSALLKLGKFRWRTSTPVLQILSPLAEHQSGRQWIISKHQSSCWLADSGKFYPPFCYYHPRARHDFKYFQPPPVDSEAFALFCDATDIDTLYFQERSWSAVNRTLGKRDLSW